MPGDKDKDKDKGKGFKMAPPPRAPPPRGQGADWLAVQALSPQLLALWEANPQNGPEPLNPVTDFKINDLDVVDRASDKVWPGAVFRGQHSFFFCG